MHTNCSWRGCLNAARNLVTLRTAAHAVRAHRWATVVLVPATAIVLSSLVAISLHRPLRPPVHVKAAQLSWPPPTARALTLPPPTAREADEIRLVVYRYLMYNHDGGFKYYFLGIWGSRSLRDPSAPLIRALRAPGVVVEPESRISRWDAAYRDQRGGAETVTVTTGGIHWTDERTVEVNDCHDEIWVRGGSGYYTFGRDDDFTFRLRRVLSGQWSIQRLKIADKRYF